MRQAIATDSPMPFCASTATPTDRHPKIARPMCFTRENASEPRSVSRPSFASSVSLKNCSAGNSRARMRSDSRYSTCKQVMSVTATAVRAAKKIRSVIIGHAQSGRKATRAFFASAFPSAASGPHRFHGPSRTGAAGRAASGWRSSSSSECPNSFALRRGAIERDGHLILEDNDSTSVA